MPAHARCVGQYLVTVPVIHTDGPGLELCFIRLAKQEAQPPPISFPYLLHVNLPHKRRPVRRDFGDLAFPQGEELIPHIDILRRILLSAPGGNPIASIPSWIMPFPSFGFPLDGSLLFLLYPCSVSFIASRKVGDACLIRQSSNLPIGRQNFYFIKETLASSLDFLNISSIAFTYSSKVITTEDPTKL